MHAMLKDRLLALFTCGLVTGVAANCASAVAQDQFITQPTSKVQATRSKSDSDTATQPREFITKRRGTARNTLNSGIQVTALPRPTGGQTTVGHNSQSENRGDVQWVPRAGSPAIRPSMFDRIGDSPSRIEPLPSSLASWPLLPLNNSPNQGIQLSLDPPAGQSTSSFQAFDAGQTTDNEQQLNSTTFGAIAQGPPAPTVPSDWERRSEMAALVSKTILDGSGTNPPLPLESADNPEGWNSVGKRLASHIRNCQALLARRAYFSAREEAKLAIGHLMQTIDLHEGSYQSEPSFVAAMTALREAQDFTDSGAVHGKQTVSVIVGAHSSDILKPYDVTSVSPLAAAEHYRIAATSKLVAAAMNHPWASELYYTLGRIDQAEAESSSGTEQANLRLRAVTLYRAAAAINPNNAIALNQLGVIFLQMDRPRDASEALVEAVRLGTTPEAAGNLIAASQQLGDQQLLAWAQRNTRPMRPAKQQPQRPNVVFMSGQAFAAMSPPPAVNRQAQVSARAPAQTVGYRR